MSSKLNKIERTEVSDDGDQHVERVRQIEYDFQMKYERLQKEVNQLAEESRRNTFCAMNIDRVDPLRLTEFGNKYDELRIINERLSKQNTKLSQQNEQLSQQNQTLSQQNEKLSHQNEVQSQQLEEIRTFIHSNEERHNSLQPDDMSSEYDRMLPTKCGDSDITDETCKLDKYGDTEKDTESLSSMDETEFEHHFLPDDTFSYLAVATYFENYLPTTAFLLAIFAVLIQVITLTIFLVDVVGFDAGNPISVPPGVSTQVRVSQLIALLISGWNQDEIRSSFNVLSLGYNEGIVSNINSGVTRYKWYSSIFIRIIVGAYTLMVTFVLILNSVTVRDVMLDFAAVTFVSELDNGAFLLSHWGYMGHKLQVLTVRIKDTPIFEKQSSRTTEGFRKIPRLVSLSIIIITVCILWGWMSYKQARGDYMYQNIFVQFGDDYSPAIGAFSGLYELVLDDTMDGMRANYIEMGTETAKFSYCSQYGTWLFQYGSGMDDLSGDYFSCWSKARSSETEELDITNTASISWYVFDDDLRLEMPLQHFAVIGRTNYYGQSCDSSSDCGDRMYCDEVESDQDEKVCVCRDGLFGLNCEFLDPCRILDIDPRSDGFLGTRSWSRRFSVVQEKGKESPIQVYGKPVYLGEGSMDGTLDGALDLMIFTGRRWILTDSNSFEDYKPSFNSSASNLAEYLAANFHAYWSNYTFYFASEPVDVGTPIDSATPVGLQWFRLETSGTKGASLRLGKEIWQGQTTIEANLFCAVCNNETNPCFYGASCRSDETCECTTGSSGELCQIPPDGNGLCNVFFNTPEFSFDGGDCCQETCTSTEQYTCGKDMIENMAGVSAYGFIGYPNCQDSRYSSKLSGSTTLFEIIERGIVKCCSVPYLGFFEMSDGVASGFEVDLCKSVASAVLGDPESIEMVETNPKERFADLNSGSCDALISMVTHTAERDIFQSGTKTGFSFVPTPEFFDGMRYAGIPPFVGCADRLDYESRECLDLKICVLQHASWFAITEGYFPDSMIVGVETLQGEVDGLEAGLCNVIAGEVTLVAEFAVRDRGFTGPTYVVGNNVYSKEPLAAVTRQDDRVWSKFVSWVFEALIQAEESGITKETANNLAPTDVFGEQFRAMFQNAVAANGNYGEIYETHLRDKIPRSGLNTINRGDSGLIYAYPFGSIETRGPDPIVGGSMENIRKRRILNCGVKTTPGFATRDADTGMWRGFDVDMCRGIAAALFSGSTNVNFIPLTTSERFLALADGTIDVLAATTTHTLTREVKELSTGEGFDFTPTIFHDGMGFGGQSPYVFCAEILDFTSSALSSECRNTRICVPDASSWLDAIRGPLDVPEENIVVAATHEENTYMFNSGECNVIAGESGQLAESTVRSQGYPADKEYLISEKRFTKEPLAIVSKSDDSQFSDFLRWFVYALFYAAERGITRDAYFEMPSNNYLFGNALTGMWQHAIEAVGNYDEIVQRNLDGVIGRGTLNNLNKGGPQFFAKRGVRVN